MSNKINNKIYSHGYIKIKKMSTYDMKDQMKSTKIDSITVDLLTGLYTIV